MDRTVQHSKIQHTRFFVVVIGRWIHPPPDVDPEVVGASSPPPHPSSPPSSPSSSSSSPHHHHLVPPPRSTAAVVVAGAAGGHPDPLRLPDGGGRGRGNEEEHDVERYSWTMSRNRPSRTSTMSFSPSGEADGDGGGRSMTMTTCDSGPHCLLTQYRRKRRLVVAVCFCVIRLRTLYPSLVSNYSTPTIVHREEVDDNMEKFATTSPVHPSDPVANLKKHVPASAVLERDTSDVGKLTSRQNSTLLEGAVSNGISHRRAFPRLVYIEDDAAMHDTRFSRILSVSRRKFGTLNKTQDIKVDSQLLETMERIADDANYEKISEYAGRDWISGLVNKSYPSNKADNCVPMSTWQTMSHPNCNVLHEIGKTRIGELIHLGSGFSNDVFRVTDDGGKYLALKLLSPKDVAKDYPTIPSKWVYTNINYDTVRRDSVVLDRLAPSMYVQPLHGYCGFALVVPFTNGGTLYDAIDEWKEAASKSSSDRKYRWDLPSMKKLRYSLDAAMGLADVHDADIVHGDLHADQYLIATTDDAVGYEEEGEAISLHIGDFNRGILLRRNITDSHSSNKSVAYCTFVRIRGTTARPPEEVNRIPQTRASDVWLLGTVIYQVLTGHRVWRDYDDDKDEARDLTARGVFRFNRNDRWVLNSTDPVDKILRQTLDMCFTYDPRERASSRDVANYLNAHWKELNGKGANQKSQRRKRERFKIKI